MVGLIHASENRNTWCLEAPSNRFILVVRRGPSWDRAVHRGVSRLPRCLAVRGQDLSGFESRQKI